MSTSFSLLDFNAFADLILVKLSIAVLEIQLSEGGSVNTNNSVLNESLSIYKLVVDRILDCVGHAGFARYYL